MIEAAMEKGATTNHLQRAIVELGADVDTALPECLPSEFPSDIQMQQNWHRHIREQIHKKTRLLFNNSSIAFKKFYRTCVQ